MLVRFCKVDDVKTSGVYVLDEMCVKACVSMPCESLAFSFFEGKKRNKKPLTRIMQQKIHACSADRYSDPKQL
jgi:hypothetical protein